jgi:hypothetical protein
MKTTTILLLGALLAGNAYPQIERAITGRVLDLQGRPVAGAAIAPYWNYRDGLLHPQNGTTTDEMGRFSIPMGPEGAFAPRFWMAFDKEYKRGGIVQIERTQEPVSFDLRLEPLTPVRFNLNVEGTDPEGIPGSVILRSVEGNHHIASFQVTNLQREQTYLLPPGQYQVMIASQYLVAPPIELHIRAPRDRVDLGSFTLEATPLARNWGRPALEIAPTATRGLPEDFKLSDLKGKWVLMEFWGFW